MAVEGVTSSMAQSLSGTDFIQNNGMGKDAFMQLLVAQLTNQDPLEPMNDTEFLGQLTQYSQLEQMMNINDNIDLGNDLTLSVNNALMTNLIGKDIKIQGELMEYSDNPSSRVSYVPPAGQNITVQIMDDTGAVIRTMNMGPQMGGEQFVQWDGTNNMGDEVAQGYYLVQVTATDTAGNESPVQTFQTGRITGLQYDQGAPILYMGSRAVNPAEIVAIFEASNP